MPDPQTPYWWWNGSDLKPFFERVMALGPDNVRIEFHPDEELLHVIPKSDAEITAAVSDVGTYNFSHMCPPDCDDD